MDRYQPALNISDENIEKDSFLHLWVSRKQETSFNAAVESFKIHIQRCLNFFWYMKYLPSYFNSAYKISCIIRYGRM